MPDDDPNARLLLNLIDKTMCDCYTHLNKFISTKTIVCKYFDCERVTHLCGVFAFIGKLLNFSNLPFCFFISCYLMHLLASK